ncbi:MAG: hypothetical protein ACO1RT_03565, partial [Planctomycetaceae bacterium]
GSGLARLRGFDASGKPTTAPVEMPAGQIIPGVKVIGEQWLVTGRAGWLAALGAGNGELQGKTDLGQPLSGPPLEVGNRLLVPGTEGLVYITTIPDSVEAP